MPKKLDSGGQGQIYEVDKDTVYKVIIFSEHYKEISELAILHSLHHPSMIKMKKWELTNRECKIYMERMHCNIYDFAKKATFERRLELFPAIFWNMVRVARFFQRNGIMNCDIKPENVMLSRDEKTVKIIDFGHIISDESYPIIGTRSYQPPELWLDDKYSFKSMVWSIGMTALEFLYRIHPIVDIIYGEDSESEYDSPSYTPHSNRKSSSRRSSSNRSGSEREEFYSYSSTDSDDEYRNKYTNLFELLMEEGASLPFRHRLDTPPEAIREKLRVINTMLERMLTYDQTKRISLDELYNHRIFDNIRAGVKEELVITKTKDQLFCDRELTPLFLTVARKLFRDEITFQAYMLLSVYLDGKQKPNRREFLITSMACLDIMSYVFSMVPSSRDMYRNVVLQLRKISEHQVFDRVIAVLKAVQFNIFFHGILQTIQHQDQDVLFPLILEMIEMDAEVGKKGISAQHLLERYMSSDVLKEHDEDYEEKDEDVQEPMVEQEKVEKAEKVKIEKAEKVKIEKQENQDRPVSEKKEKGKPVVITEFDLDPVFLSQFKEQIRLVHQQELRKKQEEELQGDVLVIEL
jgi:serine/threonine protein kinase